MSEINRQEVHTVKRTQLKTPNSQKSMYSSNFLNYIQEIGFSQPPQQCFEHYNDIITHVCIDCDYKCMCATCLQEGAHKDHVVKNIEKASKIIDRILNENLICLRSKSDLLTLLKQNVAIRKNELYSEYKQYQEIIENNFKILINDISVQRESLLIKLRRFYEHQVHQIQENLKQIKKQSELSLHMIDYLSQNTEKLEAASLCVFFKEKKKDIEKILDKERQKYQHLKRGVEEVKWIVDCNIFENIRQRLSQLFFEESRGSIQLKDRPKQRKNSTKKSIPMKKSFCQLNLSRESFTGCITPKNYDPKKKKISQFMKNNSNKKLKKSSHSSKLISMPTSPIHILTPLHKSPIKEEVDRQSRTLQKIQEEQIKNHKVKKIKPY